MERGGRGRGRAAIAAGVLGAAVLVAFLLLRGDPPGAGDSLRGRGPPESAAPEAPGLTPASPAPVAPEAGPTPAAPPATLRRFRVRGTVRGREGAPIAGATIQAAVELGLEQRPLPDATTGPDGTYAIDVPELPGASALEQSLRQARVYAVAPRHRPRRNDVEVPADGTEAVADFVLEPGTTLAGRVVAADGRAVASAQVVLCDETSGKRAHAATSADGRFAFPIGSAGRHVLWATRDGEGSAVREVDLDPARDDMVPDLVLAGSGVIEGRAVHPDGSPAPLLVVDATSETPAMERAGCNPPSNGLRGTETTTDLGGRFRLAGLVPGRYVVHPSGAEPGPEERPAAIHETGERDVRIVVTQHRWIVLAVDEGGAPLRGASYSLLGEGDDSTLSGAGSVYSLDGTVTHHVDPGMRVRIEVTAGALVGAAALVIPDDGWTHRTTVVVGTAGRTGRVRVSVRTPSGGDGDVPFRAELETHAGFGVAVVSKYTFGNADGGVSPVLPAGSYGLTVWPGRTEGGDGREAFVPVRSRIEVRGGETIPVAVDARPGGRLRLTLRAGRDPVDATHMEVSLRDRSGEALPLYAFRAEGEDRNGPAVLDRPATTVEAILPGRYVLHVTGPGVRAVERVLDVVAGETTLVDVVLESSR